MKGRAVPPPRPGRLTLAELASYTIEHPGAWILHHAHDSGCPTIRTQRGDLCNCSPDVTLRSVDGRICIPVVGGAE